MQRTVNKPMFLSKLKMGASTQLQVISSCFIILFGYTGIAKLIDVKKFEGAMIKSPPLFRIEETLHGSISVIAYTIPIIELIIVFMLSISLSEKKWAIKLEKIGIWASAIVMALFTGYVSFILAKFPGHLPCTCGGIINTLSWKDHLLLNSGLLLLAVIGIFIIRKQNKLNKSI